MEPNPTLSDATPTLSDTTPPKRSRGDLDKEALAQLQLAQETAEAAKLPQYVAPLEESEIEPTAAEALLAKIATCRTLLTSAIDERTHKKGESEGEDDNETTLVRLLRRVQTAAQQKYADAASDESWKGEYYIGHNLTVSRASLATYTEGILKKLETDTLPGVNAAFRAKLTEAHQSWTASNTGQAEAHAGAVTSRQAALTLLEEIRKERRRIQRAADFQFPLGEPEHLAARAAFHLEANRSFRG